MFMLLTEGVDLNFVRSSILLKTQAECIDIETDAATELIDDVLMKVHSSVTTAMNEIEQQA